MAIIMDHAETINMSGRSDTLLVASLTKADGTNRRRTVKGHRGSVHNKKEGNNPIATTNHWNALSPHDPTFYNVALQAAVNKLTLNDMNSGRGPFMYQNRAQRISSSQNSQFLILVKEFRGCVILKGMLM
jgi:hypothetical protein